MNEPIEVTVLYTEADFLRGMNYSAGRGKRKLLSTVLVTVVLLVFYVLFFVYFIRSNEQWGLSDAIKLGLGVVTIILVNFLLIDWSPFGDKALRNIYRGSPLLKEQSTIFLSEVGIRTVSASLTNNIEWSAVVETAETDDDIYFFVGPERSLFIPKRVFSTDEMVRFREMSNTMLGSD